MAVLRERDRVVVGERVERVDERRRVRRAAARLRVRYEPVPARRRRRAGHGGQFHIDIHPVPAANEELAQCYPHRCVLFTVLGKWINKK